MHLVAVAWIYVVLLMAIVEAVSANGTLLGAFFTLLLYGALPLSIVLYLMATPARRKALRAAQAAEINTGNTSIAAEIEASTAQADAGSQAASTLVTAERKEP